MKTAYRTSLCGLLLAAAVVVLAPADSRAQSSLDAAQASEFMGSWDMPLNTDYGSFDLDLHITDQGGKVAVSVGSPDLGGMQSVTKVSRSGDSLVLDYDANAEGQVIPVRMTIKREGEGLTFMLDAMSGAYVVSGKATRAAS